MKEDDLAVLRRLASLADGRARSRRMALFDRDLDAVGRLDPRLAELLREETRLGAELAARAVALVEKLSG